MFHGSMVALITPMNAAGDVDEKRLRDLLELQIAAGTGAILMNGTTGESPTLTDQEKTNNLKIAIEVSKGRVPIWAGTGTYCTRETIQMTEDAKKLGVAGCVVIVPYYNRPTQEGLYQHFVALTQAVSIPIIVYNHPGRTGVDILPATIDRLSHFSGIVGVKDCSGDLARARQMQALSGERIDLYTGNDDNCLAFILQGGKGVISVTTNVAPKAMNEMCHAALARDIGLAGQLNTRLMPLHKALCLESNPIPVKWAVEQLGLIEGGIRLPLMPLAEQYHAEVREAMKTAGVI